MKRESSVVKSLKRSMSKNLETPYKQPKLVDYNGDINEDWYVEFWVWDTHTEELVRKRPRGNINKYGTVLERYNEAKKFIKLINEALKNGATVGDEEEEEKQDLKNLTLLEAVDYVSKYKQTKIREGSIKAYTVLKTNLTQYLTKRDKMNFKARLVSDATLQDFSEFMKAEKGLANKSHNDYIGTFTTVINELKRVKKDFFIKNPNIDECVERLKCSSNKHSAYTMDQMAMFREEIIARGDFQLLLFIQFIFFTLARPGELRFMKIHHILNDKIWIPGDTAKSTDGDFVSIVPPHELIIQEKKLRSYPRNHYIFTTDQCPGPNHVGVNYFYKRYSKILKHFGLHDSDFNYDVYSYKHTGAINMYNSGVPLEKIQLQCRHKSIEQTMTYLRELDVFRTKDAYANVKAF